MLYLASDNSSMWNMGNLMGAFFFLVIIILGFVVYKMVAGGKSKKDSENKFLYLHRLFTFICSFFIKTTDVCCNSKIFKNR